MIFEKRKRKKAWIIPYLVFIAAAGVIFFNAGSFGKNADDEAKKNLTETVRKMAVHCYAIEGQYPQNTEYLEENYGLSYNHSRYTVHYELIGSNLMPDIFVTESDYNA